MYFPKKKPLRIRPIVDHFHVSPTRVKKERVFQDYNPEEVYGLYNNKVEKLDPSLGSPSQIIIVSPELITTF